MKWVTVFFIRHGVTPQNDDSDRFCGRTDPSLSLQGVEQIKDIAGNLKGKINFECILSSPMKRTIESTQILSEALFTPYYLKPELREIDFGQWEGLTKSEVENRFTDIFNKWNLAPDKTIPPGGEHPGELVKRAVCLKDEILKNYSGPLLLVSHRTFLKIALCAWLSIPIGNYRRSFDIRNGTLGCIHMSHKEANLLLLNWHPQNISFSLKS